MSFTGKQYDNAVEAFRDEVVSRDVADLNTGWEDVLLPLGAFMAGDALHDEKLLSWATTWLEYHLAGPVGSSIPDGTRTQLSGQRFQGIYLTPYCGEWGVLSALTEASRIGAQNPELPALIRRVADHIIDGSIRIGNGAIAHSEYVLSPWVDTLYYASAPLARAYAATGEDRYATEAVHQALLSSEYLRDATTGLFFHDANVDTGRHTDWFWSRGNGWVIMAFADVLRLTPSTTPGWSELLSIYRSLATGLLRLQHPSGLWRIVPENPESHLETSGTTMIATGLAAGVAAGYLEPSAISSVSRAWNEIITWIDADGHLLGSQKPAGPGGWETHKRSVIGETTYGTGSFLRLLAAVKEIGIL